MNQLTRDDLMGLEQYARHRTEFRARVLAHKANRCVRLGANANLYFEDRLAMQYQVQEMLRIERIFEPEGIEEELSAYNPLIPAGTNWKATFMLEYVDAEERQQALARMVGIEDRMWVEVDGFERVFGIADEDLKRASEEKTSAVHFLRFELDEQMRAAVHEGAAVIMGIDHDAYRETTQVPENVRASLAADLTRGSAR